MLLEEEYVLTPEVLLVVVVAERETLVWGIEFLLLLVLTEVRVAVLVLLCVVLVALARVSVVRCEETLAVLLLALLLEVTFDVVRPVWVLVTAGRAVCTLCAVFRLAICKLRLFCI